MTIIERKAELWDLVARRDILLKQLNQVDAIAKQKVQELNEVIAKEASNGETIVAAEQQPG